MKPNSANPVLVEVVRGAIVESRHAGAIAVADAQGRLVLALGDVERPVFPRSAVKALQAVPLVESGAADAFGLNDEELAVACASHSGDDLHIAAVRSLLNKAGLDENYLACGVHSPVSDKATRVADQDGAQPASRSTIIARASMPVCSLLRSISVSIRAATSGRTIRCKS